MKEKLKKYLLPAVAGVLIALTGARGCKGPACPDGKCPGPCPDGKCPVPQLSVPACPTDPVAPPPGPGPASGTTVKDGPTHGGEEITCDLPAGEHLHNKGGSDGAGLCVFTSIDHCARWANEPALIGLRDFMTKHPGGGWPEKVDQMIPACAQEKGLPAPPYVQHTGGDLEFLKLALKTGRFVAVTYGGNDRVYYNFPVAHMVNLVHLSDTSAVILDNNYPESYLWMTPAEFAARWKMMGGGWAVVLLKSGPPPIPVNAQGARPELAAPSPARVPPPGRTVFGDESPLIKAPGRGKLYLVGEPDAQANNQREAYLFDNVPGDRITYWAERKAKEAGWTRAWLVGHDEAALWNRSGKGPARAPDVTLVSTPAAKPVRKKPDVGISEEDETDPPYRGPAKPLAPKPAAPKQVGPEPRVVPPSADAPINFGIPADKLTTAGGPTYSLNGRRVDRDDALRVLGNSLVDDSQNCWLTIALADPAARARVAKDLETAPSLTAWRGKLNVVNCEPSHWAVAGVGLTPGIIYQGPRRADGKAVVLTHLAEYKGPDHLASALRKADPNYNPALDPNPDSKLSASLPDLGALTRALPGWVWGLLAALGGLFALGQKPNEKKK